MTDKPRSKSEMRRLAVQRPVHLQVAEDEIQIACKIGWIPKGE